MSMKVPATTTITPIATEAIPHYVIAFNLKNGILSISVLLPLFAMPTHHHLPPEAPQSSARNPNSNRVIIAKKASNVDLSRWERGRKWWSITFRVFFFRNSEKKIFFCLSSGMLIVLLMMMMGLDIIFNFTFFFVWQPVIWYWFPQWMEIYSPTFFFFIHKILWIENPSKNFRNWKSVDEFHELLKEEIQLRIARKGVEKWKRKKKENKISKID